MVGDLTTDTYDVYVDDDPTPRRTVSAFTSKSSLTHISFAQWVDGRGTFYVDNVEDAILPMFAIELGRTNCSGHCLGDENGDGDVDGSDLAALTAKMGQPECSQKQPMGSAKPNSFPSPQAEINTPVALLCQRGSDTDAMKRGLIITAVLLLMAVFLGDSSQGTIGYCDFSDPKNHTIDGWDLADYIAHCAAPLGTMNEITSDEMGPEGCDGD